MTVAGRAHACRWCRRRLVRVMAYQHQCLWCDHCDGKPALE